MQIGAMRIDHIAIDQLAPGPTFPACHGWYLIRRKEGAARMLRFLVSVKAVSGIKSARANVARKRLFDVVLHSQPFFVQTRSMREERASTFF